MSLRPNSLYYGDNLEVLRNRDDFPNDSIDLIYLDPPFNSKRDYNVLYKTPAGHDSDSQITAFEDSWHWGDQAEREYLELIRQQNTELSELIQALRQFLIDGFIFALEDPDEPPKKIIVFDKGREQSLLCAKNTARHARKNQTRVSAAHRIFEH